MLRPGLVLALALAVVVPASAENWPHFRGPEGNGISSERDLPVRFGPEENLRWRAPLDGLGTSTPIVWGDRVFVTSQIGMGPRDGRGAEFPEAVSARDYDGGVDGVAFAVFAYDAAMGSRAWSSLFAVEEDPARLPPVHPKHSLASPSAVTDGERVYVWMGTGLVVALSLDGALVWRRHLGRELDAFDVLWGHGSSPTLHGDALLLLCDHPPGAYLLALDKRTGEELWKVERGEGLRSYSTPSIARGPDGAELVVNGSRRIDGYDPESGTLLWWAGEPVTLAIPMPVSAGGVVYASRGYASGPYSAIRLGGRGDVSESHVVWHVPTAAPYVSSLVLYDGRLYMANELGIVTVVSAGSGETLWRKRLGGAFTASPVAGDDKVYLVNESGTIFVLGAGAEPQILAINEMGERMLASPAISGGALFLRSDESLLRVGGE